MKFYDIPLRSMTAIMIGLFACLFIVFSAETVYADDMSEEVVCGPSEETVLESEISDLEDSDQMLLGYFEQLLFSEDEWEDDIEDSMMLFSTDFSRDNLNLIEQAAYDAAKEKIIRVAAGLETTTDISVDLESLFTENADWQQYWTAEDLGVESVYDEETGHIADDAYAALREVVSGYYDCLKVIQALFRDCPYELFWADSLYYYATPAEYVYLVRRSGEYVIKFVDYRTYFGLMPISKYADESTGSQFDIIPETLSCARIAAARARSYAAIAEDYPDYDKLAFYKDKLCELNTYNHEAASPDYTGGYGDPWQVIYMFDGDTSTNVVCEGYAKSFQYLCELSSFTSPEIVCYSVTGDLYQNSNNLGGHMWNVIRMDDGNNYIVDVTNCDGSYPVNTYFIASYTDAVSGGYYVGRLGFIYHDDTVNLYTSEQLTINGTPYQASDTAGLLGEKCVAHSLTLNESISLNFYFDLPASLTADPGAKVVFYKDGDSVSEVMVSDAEYVNRDGISGYRFSYDIVTKEMSDTVSAVIVDSLGNESAPYEYSAKRYCERLLAMYEPDETAGELIALVKALMNYGAAAQSYFGYNTDHYANESLTEDDKVIAEIDGSELSDYETSRGYSEGYSASDISLYGVTLDLLADLNLRLYFNIPEGTSISDYTFTVNDNAANQVVLDTGVGRYGPYARISNVYAADIDAEFIVNIYQGGEQIGWVKTSPFAYAGSSLALAGLDGNLRTLLCAMYYYNVSADAYFN